MPYGHLRRRARYHDRSSARAGDFAGEGTPPQTEGGGQTNKFRPEIPVPEQFGKLLDATDGFFVEVGSVRKAFEAMLEELGLPRERETGLKLIRRSNGARSQKENRGGAMAPG